MTMLDKAQNPSWSPKLNQIFQKWVEKDNESVVKMFFYFPKIAFSPKYKSDVALSPIIYQPQRSAIPTFSVLQRLALQFFLAAALGPVFLPSSNARSFQLFLAATLSPSSFLSRSARPSQLLLVAAQAEKVLKPSSSISFLN